MSLRILFADDSVTAQNMGKKILTEAGYDVVAVSNGAAAVKKIAEQKPDIIILDVHMPGYTGLEVCEKVRGSIETLKTPVLLTVGKLEPYKPEEANRVRADGVIVKPFEASDLLATVKKFEERLGQIATAAPLVQRSIAGDRLDATDSTEHHEHTMSIKGSQATVGVPDHMASASGSSDPSGSDLSHGPGPISTNQSGPGREVAVRSDASSASVPDYELPMSSVKDSIEKASPPVIQATAENTGTATHEARPRLVEATAVELSSGPRLVARTGGTQDFEAVETKISESDFEARVAAATQAYNHATAARDRAGAAANSGVPAERNVTPSENAKKSLSMDVQEAAPSAGAETGSERNTIAEAVHRVIERFKLELVEEIVKELKAKK